MILNISACSRVQSVTVTMFSNKQVTSSFVYLEKEPSNLFGKKKKENATYAVETQMSQFYTGT